MLVVNPIGDDAGRYYRSGRSPGHWVGGGARTLDLAGAPDADALARLLHGRHPADGTALATRRTAHRRAGWDLILAAPKSVSLLVGVGDRDLAGTVVQAHLAAAADALTWLEEHACWGRRQGGLVATEGLVAARYDHTRSASGDPHLHSHVVVANVVRAGDGRWSALDSSSLWTHRRGLSAVYDLALRDQLATRGVTGPWRRSKGGTWDLAAVPEPAVRAASLREAEVASALGLRGEHTRAARRAARGRTRTLAGGTQADRWREPVSAQGFGPEEAAAVVARPAGERRRDGPVDPRAEVGEWLLNTGSSFTAGDVLAALAATVPGGCPPAAAQRWSEAYCRAAEPLAAGRSTTPEAAALDAAVVRRGSAPRPHGVAHGVVDEVLGSRPAMAAGEAAAARRLVGAGEAVRVLGTGGEEGFIVQATVIEAARQAWQRGGYEVAVLAPPEAAGRWQALTGLEPPVTGRRPDVLVLDRADRLPAPQLDALLEQASAAGAVVVLVRGGTLPARHRPVCAALDRFDTVAAGTGPAVEHRAAVGIGHRRDPAALWSSGEGFAGLAVCHGPQAAMDHLVGAWLRERRPGSMLCGLGPAEVAALNRRVRAAWRAAGLLEDSDVVLGGRPFAVGDRVVPLSRRTGPPGATGTVTAADPDRRRLVVAWGDGRRGEIDAHTGRSLGHGYALTPGGVALRPGAVILLGRPVALGRQAGRVELAAVVSPGRSMQPERLHPAPAPHVSLHRQVGRDGPGIGW